MEIRDGFSIPWLLILVTSLTSAKTGRFALLNPIHNAVSQIVSEVDTHLKSYTNLKEEYNKLLILGITDPTQLLKKFNLTITLPTPASEVNGTRVAEKAGKSADSDEDPVSYEVISPHRRQWVPALPVAAPLTSFGWAFAIFGGVITIPFLIANLVMAIIAFALNVSIRVDSPTLTALRQEQVDALATFGGVPLAIVNPSEDDGDGARWDGDNNSKSAEDESKEGFQVIKPATTRCRTSSGRSLSLEEFSPFATMERIFGVQNFESSAEKLGLVIGFVIFWVIGAGVIEYLGLDTALTLALAVIALILLTSGQNGVSEYFGGNFIQKRKSAIGFRNSCEEIDELSGEVQKAIGKEYK